MNGPERPEERPALPLRSPDEPLPPRLRKPWGLDWNWQDRVLMGLIDLGCPTCVGIYSAVGEAQTRTGRPYSSLLRLAVEAGAYVGDPFATMSRRWDATRAIKPHLSKLEGVGLLRSGRLEEEGPVCFWLTRPAGSNAALVERLARPLEAGPLAEHQCPAFAYGRQSCTCRCHRDGRRKRCGGVPVAADGAGPCCPGRELFVCVLYRGHLDRHASGQVRWYDAEIDNDQAPE